MTRIYLEELGCGTAPQNLVILYKHLLDRYDYDHWQQSFVKRSTLDAVQLALAVPKDPIAAGLASF
ncbi:MAG: hypothetical protein LAT65_13675 [Saccharospirillum sp.]|nr:hypothetical protein [Saccharospirillum sp.]